MENIIETFLAIFIVAFAPIPWLIIAIHILIKGEYWKSKFLKITLMVILVFVWAILGYWIFYNGEIFFADKIDSLPLRVLGILILVIAATLEFLTHKALGTGRIFGSTEFKQTKDKLITHGIYKYARHPRYLEHPLWALGLGLTFGYTGLIWFFVYLLMSFIAVAYFEEQELIKRYGKEYLDYKKKVPAFFVGKKF